MPLKRGKSKAVFQQNVREMVRAGHPVNQAVAAAYQTQREPMKMTRDQKRRKTVYWAT